MPEYTIGQRWISDSEPELGLGIIDEVEYRRLTVNFPQNGEIRIYAAAHAPLTRIVFEPGDEVRDREGRRYEVLESENNGGVRIYRVGLREGLHGERPGEEAVLPETRLSDSIALHQPLQRLLAGQADNPHWFELRRETLNRLNFIERSPLLGLCSARTDLIPHQLYIAHEVAQRYAPRVLLADEVGLGKTIEAGLILQQQLFSGKASRVLIIVPDTLVHQWLVEMLRRFNLRFSIFDEERSASIEAEGAGNPFFAEQLVLCSASFFLEHPQRQDQALEADWDLLIVDEAHHLAFSTQDDKRQEAAPHPAELAYRNIEAFSGRVKGLILLTATPDQMGRESQFGLLRLLDPDRFHSFAAFDREQETFAQVADLIEQLEAIDLEAEEDAVQQALQAVLEPLHELLHDEELESLLDQLRERGNESRRYIRQRLIEGILDRHGTGRVLFRNSRKTVAGFPRRVLHPHPQPSPAPYQEVKGLLAPESRYLEHGAWLDFDPRVGFVADFLARERQEKVLVICAHKHTAMALEEHLRLRRGISSSVFHEDMSIVERDRSAAYFAEMTEGAQVLVCSEIGSEGRNFQFSHRLILFDLPRNPDLLEQRIGRLDRIGQRQDVDIHAPYLEGTAQEVLFHWYHEGLNAFEHVNPVAFKVFRELEGLLEQALSHPDSGQLKDLLERSQSLSRHYQQDFARGRDRLIELNSFDQHVSQQILDDIRTLEDDASPLAFLQQVFDSFGLETEEDAGAILNIHPGEHMLVSQFAGVPDEGMRVTFDRQVALHREDVGFVSWQHELVSESMDMILQGHYGRTALGAIRAGELGGRELAPDSIVLESLYRINLNAPRELQIHRFLPSTTLRVLVDGKQGNLSATVPVAELSRRLEQRLDKNQLLPLVNERRENIIELSNLSSLLAQQQLPDIIKHSSAAMLTTLTDELKRLVALKQVNPNVRDSEIDFVKNQVRGLHRAISKATLQLEGLQVIFVL